MISYTSKKQQFGLSLIELMISMALGVGLMLGIVSFYQTSSANSVSQMSHSRTMESGRVALELLARDIRMADFRGCSEHSNINNMLDTSDTDWTGNATIQSILDAGIAGQNNVSSVSVNGKSVQDGTDVLTIRGTTDACAGVGRPGNFNTSAASLHISDQCKVDQGDILIITNCSGGDMFSVSGNPSTGGGGSGKITITHNTGNITSPSNAINNATKNFSRTYGSDARILQPFVKTFFLATGSNSSGDLSLYVDDNGTNIELVPFVTDFQVQYGEDSNGDGSVDAYKTANNLSTSEMEDVVSVQLTLIVSDGSHQEDFFDTTINIRNRVGS